jgi:MerR family transcriptional regulator, thiopeptide resistance regulator
VPYTVGELGGLVGLSRTALLYYDAIGLLKPSARSDAGYRLYSETDKARLDRIMAFRALGLPLSEIAPLLDLPEEGGAAALFKRLFEINDRIADLRAQQRGILGLLEAEGSLRRGRTALHALEAFGRRIGVGEANYRRIHASFEASSPEEHRRLLGLLGFTEAETEEFLAGLREKK